MYIEKTKFIENNFQNKLKINQEYISKIENLKKDCFQLIQKLSDHRYYYFKNFFFNIYEENI